MLLDQSDEAQLHHNQNEMTCNGHPHVHRRLSQEQDDGRSTITIGNGWEDQN